MSLRAQARNRLLFLGAIVLLIVGLGGGLLAFREFQANRASDKRLKDGLAAAAKGDDAGVVTNLGIYLQRHPADIEALAAYAHSRPKVVDAKHQQLAETAGVLRHLLQLDPKRPDDWRELMKLDFDFGMMTEANDAADGLLQWKSTDTEAWEIKSGALVQLHRYQEAIDWAEKALANAPDDWAAQIYRLEALNKLGKTDKIQKTADSISKKFPDEQGSLLVQAYASEMTNDPDGAKAKLQSAASLPCQDSRVAFKLIEELNKLGNNDVKNSLDDFNDSMVTLRHLAQTGDAEARRDMVRRLWEQGNLAEVIAFFPSPTTQPTTAPSLEAAAGAPDDSITDSESLGIYADCLRRAHSDDEFKHVLDTLGKRQNDPLAAAWVLIDNTATLAPTTQSTATRRPDPTLLRDACAKAAEATNNRDPYILYYAGAADIALGDTDKALALWDHAAQLDLTWANPLVAKAQTLLDEGRLEQAARDADAAIRRAQSENPLITQKALTIAATIGYAQIQPGDNDPNKVDHLKEFIGKVQKYLSQAKLPPDETVQRISVSLLARSDDTRKTAAADARALLAQVQAQGKHAGGDITLLSLASISRQYDLGAEDDCVKTFETQYGRTPESALSWALNDYNNKKPDAGLQLLLAAETSAPPDQIVGYQLVYARYLEFVQNPDDTKTDGWKAATAAWVKLGDANPKDLSVQRAVIASKAAFLDREFYDRSIQHVQTLEGPDSTTWKLARARWKLDGSPDPKTASEAISLLQEVAQREQDSVGTDVLLAIAKQRQGDISGATAQLEAAQRQDPQSAAIDLGVATLMQDRGDYSQAQQELEHAANQKQASPELLAKAATLMAQQGDMADAQQAFEKLADNPESTSPSINLALATVYCQTKQFDKAQKLLDELIKNPSPQVIILSAQLQMFQRHPEKAEQILAKLNELTLPPGEALQWAGNFRYSFNQVDAAAQLFRQAAQAAPGDPIHWLSLMDAQCLQGKPADVLATADLALKSIPKDANSPKIAADINHIQAVLAQKDLMLAASDGPTQRRLLSALVNDPSPTGAAVHTLQTMETLEASDMSVDDVLKGLQKLSNDLPRFLPAQTALTDAQLRAGRCADAVNSASHSVQAFPTDAEPAEQAVKAFIQLGQSADALQMAQTWRDRVVGNTLDADLRIAQMQLNLGDPDRCMTTLQPYLTAPYATDLQKWEVAGTQAQALVAEGKPADAVTLLWPLAQASMGNQSDWMGFTVKYLPSDQAETWLNKMGDWLKTKPEFALSQIKLASAWDSLAEKTNDKRFSQTARDLVHSLAADPQIGATAVWCQGQFDEEDGDFKGAQAAYREAISMAKSTPSGHLPEAENNLAMLLVTNDGDMKEAVSLAQQCVKDDPQATYYDTLATVLSKNKDYAGAAAAEQTALNKETNIRNIAKWHVNLARLMIEQGKRDQATQVIAELDLMTPGTSSLPDSYQQELTTLRGMLDSGPTTRPLRSTTRPS